jgi:hypothetical protein
MQKRMYPNKVQSSADILDVIDQLPKREYNNMADVEKSIQNIL